MLALADSGRGACWHEQRLQAAAGGGGGGTVKVRRRAGLVLTGLVLGPVEPDQVLVARDQLLGEGDHIARPVRPTLHPHPPPDQRVPVVELAGQRVPPPPGLQQLGALPGPLRHLRGRWKGHVYSR